MKIHQTWKTENPPPHWEVSRTEWKRLHPECEYMFWTDAKIEEFMKSKYRQFYSWWRGLPYAIQRVDVAKYCILDFYGGIYSDMDIVPNRSVLPWLDSHAEAHFVRSANCTFVNNSFTNCLMVSNPGAKIWGEVFKEMVKPAPFWVVGQHWTIIYTTGPMLVDRVLRRSKEVFATGEIVELPREQFNATSTDDIENGIVKQDTVLRNIPGFSWHGWDTRTMNNVYRNRAAILLIILFLVFVLIVAFWRPR